jgi:hypothetical protein
VLGGRGLYSHPAHVGDLARHELLDLREARSAQECAGAGRRQHPDVARQQAKRAEVEVVVVEMGQQHRVELRRQLRHRPATAQVRDPAAQHRVGEQADATELEEHGGVAQPGDSRGRA